MGARAGPRKVGGRMWSGCRQAHTPPAVPGKAPLAGVLGGGLEHRGRLPLEGRQ